MNSHIGPKMVTATAPISAPVCRTQGKNHLLERFGATEVPSRRFRTFSRNICISTGSRILPSDTLRFFLGASRYLDSDSLGNFAWAQFRNTQEGWPRWQANPANFRP